MAYLYSSRVDTGTMLKFFEGTKIVCNAKKPNVFMSDDYNAYYDA